jgi:hypothetical protein
MNMTTETQSNSKFYHGDCLCEKNINTSIVAIQCKYCIEDNKSIYWHSKGYNCLCKDVKIKHMVCNICGSLRDKIDLLNNELDKLSYNMIDEIKQYFDCKDKIQRITEISLELRHLNRKILQNLIIKKNAFDTSSDEYDGEEEDGKDVEENERK